MGENSDFDFNDVVFDVFWNSELSVTTIRLQAAGGELPLYIGSVTDAHEVHKLFGFTNSYPLINTGWKSGVTKAPVDFTISGSYPDRTACKNIPVYEFTPGQIKLAVTGYGKADKNQVSQMVVRLLGLKEVPKPDDACDGLAVAICLANTGIPFAERAVSGYQYGRYGKREFI